MNRKHRRYSSPICRIISIVLILASNSCRYFTEPEPFFNKAAHSLQIDTTTAILSNYFMNQVVTGDIDPVLVPGLNPSVIDSIKVYIDTIFMTNLNGPPYQFHVNTRTWSNGKHDLLFYIYENNGFGDSAGILKLIPPPAHIYRTALIFDGHSLVLSLPQKWSLDNVNNTVIFEEIVNESAIRLESFSTQNCTLLSTNFIEADELFAQNKSLDGKVVYFLTRRVGYYYLQWINSNTLEREVIYLSDPSMNDACGFSVGDAGKAYFSDSHGILQILNYDGTKIGSYNLFDGPARFLNISPDGSQMVAVDNKGVKMYSLNGDSAILSIQSQITDRVNISRVDWLNSRLFITRQNTTLETWDLVSLNPISSFKLPESIPTATNITALMANSKSLYAAYTIQKSGNDSSLVVEYDIPTRSLTRSWNYANNIESLLGSDNGRYIFAVTFKDQWIIDIGGTP